MVVWMEARPPLIAISVRTAASESPQTQFKRGSRHCDLETERLRLQKRTRRIDRIHRWLERLQVIRTCSAATWSATWALATLGQFGWSGSDCACGAGQGQPWHDWRRADGEEKTERTTCPGWFMARKKQEWTCAPRERLRLRRGYEGAVWHELCRETGMSGHGMNVGTHSVDKR
jgi:hypothetical protein